MTLSERMVEAAARAMVDADLEHGMWDRMQANAFHGAELEKHTVIHQCDGLAKDVANTPFTGWSVGK